MDLRVLSYFLAIAKAGSFSEAALRLHLTQPTLSRQILDLEEELGTKLLNRTRNNKLITLTEDGMFLCKKAEELLELAAKTKNELAASHQDISGSIYIGAGEFSSMGILAKAAKVLTAQHPKINYHLFSGNAESITERLNQGLLDFGVVIGTVNMHRYNFMKLPHNTYWGILMPKSSPLAKKEIIHPQDIWDKPLIISRQSFESNELSAWLEKDIKEMKIIATYNLLYNALFFIEEGLGLGIVLANRADKDISPNLCFRPLVPKLESATYIIWKKNQQFSRATELFLQELERQ